MVAVTATLCTAQRKHLDIIRSIGLWANSSQMYPCANEAGRDRAGNRVPSFLDLPV